jgi:hypothetical protein
LAVALFAVARCVVPRWAVPRCAAARFVVARFVVARFVVARRVPAACACFTAVPRARLVPAAVFCDARFRPVALVRPPACPLTVASARRWGSCSGTT